MNRPDRAQTVLRPRPGATGGDWWRFDSYEIREGSIRPAEGAKLHWYEPWQEFQATRGMTVGQLPGATQPAYQSLMELVSKLKYHPGARRYPDCVTESSQRLILDWCQQHGPLGILLSRWEAISLAPKLRGSHDAVQRKYFRGFGQVIETREISDVGEDAKASVLIHELHDLTLVDEPPGKTWNRFFPSVGFGERDTFAYPQPYTLDFCKLYAEPLYDFCKAATLLADAMLNVGQASKKPSDSFIAEEQALLIINLLRRAVVADLQFDAGRKLTGPYVAPSLLAAFAEMFVQDQLFGRALLQCISCGTPFISTAYRALYCSRPCRLREQKRRLRRQMKEAKRLRGEGRSLRQIVKAIGQPLAIIKGWVT